MNPNDDESASQFTRDEDVDEVQEQTQEELGEDAEVDGEEGDEMIEEDDMEDDMEDTSYAEDRSTVIEDIDRSKAGTPSSTIDPITVPWSDPALALAMREPGKRGGVKGARAKAVDCLNLEGTVIGTYPSGLIASKALGISQGDVSLCCRGLRDSVSIYRFRFHGDTTDYSATKAKRVVEDEINPSSALGERRLKRQLRNQAEQSESSVTKLFGNADQKARRWDMQIVNVGPFTTRQWVPRTKDLNPALQQQRKSLANQPKKTKISKQSVKQLKWGKGG